MSTAAAVWTVVLFLFGMFFLPGCSSFSSLPDVPLQSSYSFSRQGLLHYRVPVGWFDASRDSQFVSAEIWLVRNDYAATITVAELVIDEEARRGIDREGLQRLAQLSLSLFLSNGSAVTLNPPEPVSLGGPASYAYTAMKPETGDTVRVVLLDTGRRVYEATALVRGRSASGVSSEAFSAQRSFLKSLRW